MLYSHYASSMSQGPSGFQNFTTLEVAIRTMSKSAITGDAQDHVPTSPVIMVDRDVSSIEDESFTPWQDQDYKTQGKEVRERIKAHRQEMIKHQTKITNLQHALSKMDVSRIKRSRREVQTQGSQAPSSKAKGPQDTTSSLDPRSPTQADPVQTNPLLEKMVSPTRSSERQVKSTSNGGPSPPSSPPSNRLCDFIPTWSESD